MRNTLALLISLISLAGFGQGGWDWSHFVSAPTGAPTDYIAYYKFSGDVTDETGDHDGTNNGVTFVTDVDGNASSAGKFVKSEQDYVTVSSIGYTSSFTVSTLFLWDGTTANNGIFSKGAFNSTQGDINITVNNDAVNVRLMPTTQTFNSLAYEAVSDSVWRHLVVMFDEADSTGYLYINGDSVSSQKYTHGLRNDNTIIRIGMYYASTFGYDGLLDEFMYFDRPLSSAEITALKESFLPE